MTDIFADRRPTDRALIMGREAKKVRKETGREMIPFGTAFSGADAVAACVESTPSLADRWRQVFCAEMRDEDWPSDERLREESPKDIAHKRNSECACSVLAKRCRGVPNLGDIMQAERPGTPLLLSVMGSPCTEFCMLGHQRGRHSVEGALLLEAVRKSAHFKGECIILENAKSLRSKTHDSYLEEVKDILRAGGMQTVDGVLDPRMFGVPCARPRTYIIGMRTGLKGVGQFADAWPDSLDFRRDEEADDEGLVRTEREIDWSEYLDAGIVTPDSLPSQKYASNLVADKKKNKWDKVDPSVSEAFDRAARAPFAPEDLADAEASLPEGEPVFWTTQFGIKHFMGVCPTITRGGRSGQGVICEINGKLYPRSLSGHEAMRLQGFPEGWCDVPHLDHPERSLNNAEIYSLMGNSMSIDVLRWLLSKFDEIQAPYWDISRASRTHPTR